MRCPHCGAPPPSGFVVPFGQFSYSCVYCKQSSVHGEAPATVAQGPTFIVIHGPSSDDFDDDDDDHPAALVHGNVARNMPWLLWVVVVVVISLGGSGAAFMRCGRHSTIISSLVWDGTEPLQCAGNDDIAVSNVQAVFAGGSAIQASGNCHVRCTDCTITAPTAIEASGNAQITLVNGTIRGTSVLADATGNARVTISGNVTVAGRVRESGSAKVSAPPPAAEPATAASAAASAPAQKAAASAAPGAAARPAKGQGSPPRPKATAGK